MASNSPKQHTAGPWNLSESKGGALFIYSESSSQPIKPQIRVPRRGTKQMFANARLIAAAPDLLVKLRHLVHQLEWHIRNNMDFGADHQRVKEAKEIIARIEGE
jgi:hypothetical protein